MVPAIVVALLLLAQVAPPAPPPVPAGAEQVWYVTVDGAKLGPLSHAEVDALVASGRANRATLLWKAGMPTWLAIGDEPSFASAAPSAPSAAPSPGDLAAKRAALAVRVDDSRAKESAARGAITTNNILAGIGVGGGVLGSVVGFGGAAAIVGNNSSIALALALVGLGSTGVCCGSAGIGGVRWVMLGFDRSAAEKDADEAQRALDELPPLPAVPVTAAPATATPATNY